jgi:hypothetical protein
MGKRLAFVMVFVLGGAAHAQSINVSFGHTSGAPASTYAAAGAAGTWNAITGVSGPSYDHLAALDGSTTDISMTQSPTTTVLSGGDSSVTGDDAALLENGLVTTGAETCLMFSGFDAGTYEVLIYAWVPSEPTTKSRTRQDEAASTIDVGGAWPGEHQEGVTYARYVVTVGSDGNLPAHSGLAPNMPSAALNGVQIRPLPAPGSDAGMTAGADAGTGSGSGSNNDTADAGTTTTEHHAGGCAVAGGGVPGLVVALALVLCKRHKRRASRVDP